MLCLELYLVENVDDSVAEAASAGQFIYWQVKFPFPLSNRDVSFVCWADLSSLITLKVTFIRVMCPFPPLLFPCLPCHLEVGSFKSS